MGTEARELIAVETLIEATLADRTRTIVVIGTPISQPRQRHAVIAGHVRNYTPSDHPVNFFKSEIRSKWEWHVIEGPVSCEITAIFPRPKSKTKKRGPNEWYWHTSRPDADNVSKAVMDALNGVAWKDDSQVSGLMVIKKVASGDELARTEVTVRTLSNDA